MICWAGESKVLVAAVLPDGVGPELNVGVPGCVQPLPKSIDSPLIFLS